MNKRFKIGLTVICLIILAALFAPWLAPQDPNQMSLPDCYGKPSWSHPFGLDQNGSDVFSQIVFGARISLAVSLIVVSVSVAVGLILGSLAGYLGGWTDLVIMRFIDMIYAFPGFLLALTLVAVLGPSVRNLIFAMCLTSWTGYARMVRGEVLHLKNREYVLGAIALGARPSRLLIHHIWPNLFSLLIVQATFGISGAVLTESGLSFLGLGAPANVPTWGALLNSGRHVLVEAPHVSLFPGLAILALVLGFNFVGEGLRTKILRLG